jgi:peptide/nickel transport system substrate-binding protein
MLRLRRGVRREENNMLHRGIWRRLVMAPLAIILVACTTATPVAPVNPTAPAEATDPGSQPAARGGSLTIGMGYETPSFDPHSGNAYDQQYIHMNIFDPLIWRAPDGTLVPGLAERWDVSEDGKTFTFYLRQDVKFHDGTPMNAESVKFSFDRIVAPDFPSFTTRNLMGPYESSTVLDEFTVQVNFSASYLPFLDAVSQWWLVPVSPAAVERYGADFGQNPVGTGPFIWKERVEQDSVTLVRNPDYNWAPSFFEHQGPAYLESITYKFVPEEASRAGVLESGEVQVSQNLPPVDLQRLQNNSNLVLHRIRLPGQPTLLFLNTECGPTADLAVRQALQWATPKQSMIDAMWGGFYEPAYGPLTPGLLGYDPAVETMYGQDPERARQILEEAGWVDTNGDGIREKDGQPLHLALNTMSFNRYPEVLQLPIAAWKEVGMDAGLTVMTFPQFSGAAWACEHSLMPYFTPASDPYFVTSNFYMSKDADAGFNFSRIRSAELDDLLTRGATATDTAERERVYQAASRLIMEEAAVLPIYISYNLTMAHQSVKNLQFSSQGWYALLYDVYIEN